MTYQEENNILFNSFLEDHFYKRFREGDMSIEFIISPKCNLGCKYCYIHKYAHKSFPESIYDTTNIITNVSKLLRWMDKNDFFINIDIFSGEPLAQEIGYEVLDTMLEFYKSKPKERRIPSIIMPTNFTFLVSEDLTNRIEKLISDFSDIGIKLILSASFDGKYMEQNRPFTKDLDIPLNPVRDDEYYDKVFLFCKKHAFGFHPMIYAEGIEHWIKNFNWFQEMFDKHDMDWQFLYLLTVRNDNWNVESNRECYKFMRYLVDFVWNKLNGDEEKFREFLQQPSMGFNLLSWPLMRISRGIGCSMQTTLGIRVSDMTHHPCHRLMYKGFEIGRLVDDEENILKYETANAELGLTTYGFSTKMQPMCIKCPINRICVGGCVGSQYESTGDMYTPIESVCKNQFWTLKGIIDGLNSIGMLDKLTMDTPLIQRNQIKFLKELELK